MTVSIGPIGPIQPVGILKTQFNSRKIGASETMQLRFRQLRMVQHAILLQRLLSLRMLSLGLLSLGLLSLENPSCLAQPPAFPKRDDDVLIIGSADTLLVSADDSGAPIFAESFIEESDLPSTLALQIATATFSHVSPFFFWMSGPTSDLFAVEAEAVADKDSIGSVADLPERTLEVDTNLSLGSVNKLREPPRIDELEAAIVAPPMLNEPAASIAGEVASEQKGSKESETLIRKPAPRTVRIPFEKLPVDAGFPEERPSDASRSRSNDVDPPTMVSKPLARKTVDPDSQQEQEAPKIESANKVTERDLQGIDAISAAKPSSNRREVRIDNPALPSQSPAPIAESKSLDPVVANRLQRADACLNFYLTHPESTADRSPWAVMHATLAFGGEYEMIHGTGRVNAIGWMCHNGTCRTQRMFTPRGKSFIPNVGGGVQGHEGQFLAILAQSNVPLDYPIQIGTSRFTVEDLVRHEMATCKEKSELTFKLIALSYYLDSNKQWRANDGKTWSIQKLIQEELDQPIVGSACGGTHRLMGFSFSVRQRQLQGQPVNGQYARAAKFVREYVDYTWQLQNPDGSFSTSWYEGRANEPSAERKVQTSGHMLEWLMFTMSDQELNQPKVGKAIDFLLSKIYDKRENKWPIGPRGHATRAVALYESRTREIASKPSVRPSTNAATRSQTKPIRK